MGYFQSSGIFQNYECPKTGSSNVGWGKRMAVDGSEWKSKPQALLPVDGFAAAACPCGGDGKMDASE